MAGVYPTSGRIRKKGHAHAAPWAEVKSPGSTTQNLLLSGARHWPAAPHTRNKTLTGLATVASAGAVWLLKSLKVQAKKTAAEGLEFFPRLVLGILVKTQDVVFCCD
ncbi:hypothetical protein [Pseudomonas sp. zfem002]|uniref:hypothetical protein n=1 Tax=Pseudomonas sp. zfem002 TaxID=3078197 RepID=UPI0029286EDE|nr:hypothetical protein [Pseudomonas sp. zfem002]MDU9390702.1 hypothetical protein [Pseudomonas sp. zfem002]